MFLVKEMSSLHSCRVERTREDGKTNNVLAELHLSVVNTSFGSKKKMNRLMTTREVIQ